MVCVIQITGNKDVGKTALAERLISMARSLGYRVVAVKQSHHAPDVPGKDSYRMRVAGADVVVLRGGGMWAVFSDRLSLCRIDSDLVVIEGFRDAKLGFKIHIGPDPPADADVVVSLDDALRRSEEFLRRARCDVDADGLLAFLAAR
ncbi:MAG: molybdopterin-guanine dinucleotide biosynthesis protein B [Thermoproteus sp.]